MDTYETIRTVRSVREFDLTRTVADEVVLRILNAGRLSGSSKNTQPWQFILIRERGTLVALSKCGDYAQHLAGAAFGIAILTQAAKRAEYDAGRCSQNMMLAAWNEGVGSCIASMHREQDAKHILDIPTDYTISQIISFGYPAASVLERIPMPRKGGRNALDDILHFDVWGKQSEHP